jgi:hypothetical protein
MNSLVIPETLTFDHPMIFGKPFMGKRGNYKCVLTRLLMDEILSLEGDLDLEKIQESDLSDIWVYVYYLWTENHRSTTQSGRIFEQMSMTQEETQKRKRRTNTPLVDTPSAIQFVRVIASYLLTDAKYTGEIEKILTAQQIAFFINHLVHDLKDQLLIPFKEVLLSKLLIAVTKNNEELRRDLVNLEKAFKATRKSLETRVVTHPPNGVDIQVVVNEP